MFTLGVHGRQNRDTRQRVSRVLRNRTEMEKVGILLGHVATKYVRRSTVPSSARTALAETNATLSGQQSLNVDNPGDMMETSWCTVDALTGS